MCGIIISDLVIPKNASKFVEKRGPDDTNEISYKDINFVHFLLHLTGKKTLQPIWESKIYDGNCKTYLLERV